jgi:hypothetical protein
MYERNEQIVQISITTFGFGFFIARLLGKASRQGICYSRSSHVSYSACLLLT